MGSTVSSKIRLNGLRKLTKDMKELDSQALLIGILGKEANRSDGESNALIGATHELGSFSKGIPARSWLRFPIEFKQKEIEKFAFALFSQAFSKSQGNPTLALNQLGLSVVGVIQDAFDTRGFGKWKALSQTTVDNKGTDQQLIETGKLRRAVTHQVRNK